MNRGASMMYSWRAEAVNLAREGLEEGYRAIAHQLNQVLADVAPGVRIRSKPQQPGDSLEAAADKIRRALPFLQIMSPHISTECCPWLAGAIPVSVVHGIGSVAGFNLTEELERLRRISRTTAYWRKFARSIETYHRETLAALNSDVFREAIHEPT